MARRWRWRPSAGTPSSAAAPACAPYDHDRFLAPDIAALKELVQSDLFLDLVPSEVRLTAGA